MQGAPTDGALITLARKAGLTDAISGDMPRLDVIPFESEHKFMATLHRRGDNDHVIFIKGAPARLVAMCSHERRASDDVALDRERWLQIVEETAAKGQRTLAVAVKDVGGRKTFRWRTGCA